MGGQITLKNDGYSKCPNCNGELEFQKVWEELFDMYDGKFPAIYMVINEILKDGVPKYICKECNTKILVSN